MPEETHLLHVQDLVLHLLQGTLRLRLLQPGLHQFPLQLQDGLLGVPRDSLLQRDRGEKHSEAELQMLMLVCVVLVFNQKLNPKTIH